MSKKTISPAKEREETKAIKAAPQEKAPRRGISAPQAVFLSLLTYVMLAAGAFAFRDQLAPYTKYFMGDSVANAVEEKLFTLPAFVPVPASSAVPEFDTSHQDNAIADLKTELTALKSQLTDLRNQPAPEPVTITTSSAAPAIDAATLQNIENAQISLAAAMRKINTLEAQLNENTLATSQLIEKSQQAPELADMRGLIAFQTLQSQATSGQPFQAALQRVIALAGDSSAIQAQLSSLEQVAPTGRLQLADLQQQFASATRQFMQDAPAQTDDFFGKVKGNLSSFIRVRRTDENASDNDAIVAAAETALSRGKVKAAYAEILKLDDASRAIYKDWLAQAKTYHLLPEWLNALQLHLTATVESDA